MGTTGALAVSFVTLCVVSCAANRGIQKSDNCDVPGLDWMTASDKYDRTLVASLAARFEVAAKADANNVKYVQDATAAANLGGDVKSTATVHRERGAVVSQAFYQQAIAYRTSVCALKQMLKDGNLTGSVADRARESLVDMSVVFGRIKEIEEPALANAALLLGYDAAFALAHAKLGTLSEQERARIAEYLRQLDIATAFPENPMGVNNDAQPAADFAQRVAGTLDARDRKAQRAFLLGWLGVITLNTPALKPAGFDLRRFASEAGFLPSPHADDTAFLEQLVELARR